MLSLGTGIFGKITILQSSQAGVTRRQFNSGNECLLLEDLVQSCVRGKGGK